MARFNTSPNAAEVILFLLAVALIPLGCRKDESQPESAGVVAVPARAGIVEGKTENSDAFIWQLFTGFVAPVSKNTPSPVIFETWASDKDTFSAKPHWPKAGEPMELQISVLAETKTLRNDSPGDPHPETDLLAKIHSAVSPTITSTRAPGIGAATQPTAQKIDVNCEEPPGAAVGGFPMGDSSLCIAEQVARNYPQWNYIVSNHLNTQLGLKEAFAKSLQVEMPTDSIAIKADWVPLAALLKWVPELGNLANIKKQYYTAVVEGTDYALVSMHVSSRQNPNWVWGTFEHQMNPGRCDYIGCFDSFGAQTKEVAPNKAAVDTQYGTCPKTQQLKTLMNSANLSPIWENYCLKSTQVDYVAADGTPSVLGNSVIEGIVGNGTIASSSCISCHAYASFGPAGAPTKSALKILPFNPTGRPIPGVLAGSHPYAFMWGVVQAK